MSKKKTTNTFRKLMGRNRRLNEKWSDTNEKMPVGVRIKPSSAKFYWDNFYNTTSGATFVLEFFPVIYRRTIAELKGRFDSFELRAILSMMKGAYISPKHLGRGFIERLEENMILKDVPHDISLSEAKETVTKFKGLTAMQYAVLELWANLFWDPDSPEPNDAEDEHRQMDGYVSELLADAEEEQEEVT